MKNEDVDNLLNNLDLPEPENIKHQQELKLPLLSFKKSSRAGLWLLLLPATFAITVLLKYELGLFSSILNYIESIYTAVGRNSFLTYLIPVVFVGFPLIAMIINLLAFCHFTTNNKTKELLITVKYRPLNIALFLFSFVILIYAFLPDALP